MAAFQNLSEEHSVMDGLAERLLACVLPNGYDVGRAMRLRRRLERALDAHLAHEDPAMYQGLAARAVPRVANDNRDLGDELHGLCQDWQCYLDRWADDAVATDPDGFATETRTMMLRLRERIALEQQCLAHGATIQASDDFGQDRVRAVG